jgi:uncharacterized glyoxalase superfamily protein PhnB
MTQSLFPVFRYRDADAAIAWLIAALGARAQDVYRGEDGVVEHAQIEIEGELIMLGTKRDDAYGELVGDQRTSLYVAVEDPDAHHARAVEAGAEVVRALSDMDYGSREYGLRDPEGNVWSFGTYRPAVTGAAR